MLQANSVLSKYWFMYVSYHKTGLISTRNFRSSWAGYNLWESRDDSSEEETTQYTCGRALNQLILLPKIFVNNCGFVAVGLLTNTLVECVDDQAGEGHAWVL